MSDQPVSTGDEHPQEDGDGRDERQRGQEMFFGVQGSGLRDLAPELEQDLRRRREEQLEARGPVTVRLPQGCVRYAVAQDREARRQVELPTTGEVEVPAGMLLSLGLDGADEHAEAIGSLRDLPADVLGLLSVDRAGCRTLRAVAMLDWPRLMPRIPGRRAAGDGAMRLELSDPDVTALAARWPTALQLVLPPGAAVHDTVDGVVLHGVEVLEVRSPDPLGRLLARLPQAAPDLTTLVLEPGTLDHDWSPLRRQASLRSLSVFHGDGPPVAPVVTGEGATALLEVAVTLPGLRELTLYTGDGIGPVDATGCSVSLEELTVGAGAVDGGTVLTTSRLPRLRVLVVDGVDDIGARTALMAQIARDNGVLPHLAELSLRGSDAGADEPEEVLDAEDALVAARTGLSVNGIEYAPSVLA